MEKNFSLIIFASDHAGFERKTEAIKWVKDWGYEYKDVGDFAQGGSDKPDSLDDYPDFMDLAAQSIINNPGSCGIVFGGSGQGEAMALNGFRFQGIRAGVYYGGNLKIVKLLRDHNNANALSLSAREMDSKETKEAIKMFLETPFSNEERHKRRVAKLLDPKS
jgi:ribose 5-phosphate isomerase B